MVGPMIGTPAPDVTTTSLNSEGFDGIDDLALEDSFMPPADRNMLLKGGRQQSLRTPRLAPLQLLPNGHTPRPSKAEFTPLLKSVARTNISKRMSNSARRRGHDASETPVMNLPRVDESMVSVSSAGRNDFTPMPQNLSSSAASTPLAQLPTRDGNVVSDGNVMTLREQENIIDKIEKENFGLKMKIHFLEENLSKRGGEFNQAALKENTDLKVNRITMQRELHKFKKTIAQAERDAELYRRQLEEYRERVRQKKVDETIRIELASMKSELQEKDEEVKQLRAKYEQARGSKDSETEKLRDEVADLQADLRERDRQLEDREDEIDALRSDANKGSNATADLEEELESARQELEDVKRDYAQADAAKQQADDEKESAANDKRKAEEELHELQEEMANKSIVPQGLSRQLEERAAKFEDDYHELQEKFKGLKLSLEGKSQSERVLQERLRAAEKEGSSEMRQLQQELEAAQQKFETFERKYSNLSRQVDAVNKELSIMSDEKDLLQTRHDALTTESAQLQDDLVRARKTITTLESAVDEEKQQATHNENQLRQRHRSELDHLTDQVDTLHQEASKRDEQHATEVENWAAERRILGAVRDKAEERANGLQRTVDKLNDAHGTLSGKDLKMQEALDSEIQRHSKEELVLARQIDELNQDLLTKRTTAEENRAELNNAREELRISVREQALLKEKITELEDEIEVLQADIEQEHELAQQIHQKSSSTSDNQLMKIKKEKTDLQHSLANLRLELETTKRASEATEAERDDLEAQLAQTRNARDDTFDMQQEKREMRRERQRLENDLEKLRAERDALVQANNDLNEELDAEIDRANVEEHRLNAELDSLRAKKPVSTDNKDKDLLSEKRKVQRLEDRIRELEDMLEEKSRKLSSPDIDVSGLKHDLTEARKNESFAAKRESDLKSSNRELKMKINDLERQLHEARLAELKAISPASSVSSGGVREVSQLRQEVFNTRAELKTLRDENQRLRRSAQQAPHVGSPHALLQSQLESKTVEVEVLVEKLAKQSQLGSEMRRDLARIRSERDDARGAAASSTHHEESIQLRSKIQQLRNERNEARDNTAQIASRSKEALALKSELTRLREERGQANSRVNTVEKELDIIQSRYESLLERLTSGPVQSASTTEKEVRGLMKEVLWLKAKLRREERLRKDLAWSKTYLENGESMRARCNQVDLRILREMGISLQKRAYEPKLLPVQKFRAGVFCVIGTLRMMKMSDQWRNVENIGKELVAKKARKLGERQILQEM